MASEFISLPECILTYSTLMKKFWKGKRERKKRCIIRVR